MNSGVRHGDDRCLVARGMVKRFGTKTVVDDVDLEARQGEIVGLLGPNGAGKTTIFYMLTGALRPTKGRVFIRGEDITEMPMYLRARKGLSYLPQEPSVFRKLSVEENLIVILEFTEPDAQRRRERCQEILRELRIEHLAKNKAYSLSGGERRRVEICRALVTSPYFMLLDEPFAGIDPLAVIEIQNIVRSLKERDIGVIITDHNVRETLGVCDRAYIINEGKILEAGTPDRIASSERARRFYLGESFRL
ncbi:MAG: LPS export ABC transporter ATP-binding protein [Thermodesulfobacteriota bacterium]